MEGTVKPGAERGFAWVVKAGKAVSLVLAPQNMRSIIDYQQWQQRY